MGLGPGGLDQLEPHPRLDPEGAAIGSKQAGEIGAIGAEEIRSGRNHPPIGQHHVKADRAIDHGAAARAPEHPVLAHPPADGGADARKRAPGERAQPARGERGVERLPGAADLDEGGKIGLVDLDDPVERPGIDEDVRPGSIEIAAGVAHPPAARDDGDPGARGSADPGGKLIDALRAQHCQRRCTLAIDIVAEQGEACRIGEQRLLGHGGAQGGKRIVGGKAGHQAGSIAASPAASPSASGRVSG